MTNNKHPINTAKDMQSLKMRVPNSKAYIAMMQATGASTVAVDLSELYLALRQGVADGQDTPPSVVKSNKYYEVQKYMSKTDHILTTAYTVTNPKFFDGLTPDEKKPFTAACGDADDWLRQYTQKDEAEAYDFLKAQGMQVNAERRRRIVPRRLRPVIDKNPRPVPARSREARAGDARMRRSACTNCTRIAMSKFRQGSGGERPRDPRRPPHLRRAVGDRGAGRRRPAVRLHRRRARLLRLARHRERRASPPSGTTSRRSRAFPTRRAPRSRASSIAACAASSLPHVESRRRRARAIDAAYFAPLGSRSFGAGRPGVRPAHRQPSGVHAGLQRCASRCA